MRASRRVAVHAVIAFSAVSALNLVADAQQNRPAGGASGSATAGTSSGSSTTAATGSATPAPAGGSQAGGSTRPARVDPVVRPPEPTPEPRWGHQRQVSIRFAAAEGARLAIRYGNGDPCGGTGAIFCYGRAPVLFDAVLGFAPISYLEVEARVRFGETVNNGEVSAGGSLPVAAGIGIRYYGTDQSPLKFIFGFAAMIDFTAPGSGAAARFPSDIVFRAEEGLQYDLARYFGVYAQLGETISFLRSLALIVDAGIGIQGRFP